MMNRLVKWFAMFTMLLVVVVPLAGCGSSKDKVTGTYTASAEGMGVVTVTIRFKDSVIEEVEILAPDETESIGGRAIPTLIEQLKEVNSPKIDGVSGATWTSDAVKEAAEEIFDEADIDDR